MYLVLLFQLNTFEFLKKIFLTVCLIPAKVCLTFRPSSPDFRHKRNRSLIVCCCGGATLLTTEHEYSAILVLYSQYFPEEALHSS